MEATRKWIDLKEMILKIKKFYSLLKKQNIIMNNKKIFILRLKIVLFILIMEILIIFNDKKHMIKIIMRTSKTYNIKAWNYLKNWIQFRKLKNWNYKLVLDYKIKNKLKYKFHLNKQYNNLWIIKYVCQLLTFKYRMKINIRKWMSNNQLYK